MKALHAFACVVAVSALALGLCSAQARAQTCHTPSFREPRDGGFHLALTQLFATFSEREERGEYQGLMPALTWSHPWVTAELAMPVYRLQQGDEEAIGAGDLTATARVAVFRTDGGEAAFGPELAVMFPTGDADRGLGMGHVMAMPGAWLRVEWQTWSILAQLGYGRALASNGHAHHHDHDEALAAPRVNPMNASELEHSLGVGYAVHPNLSATARWLGAIPFDDGVQRQLIGPGLSLEGSPLDAALELQLPIAGDPFDFRLSIAIGAQL